MTPQLTSLLRDAPASVRKMEPACNRRVPWSSLARHASDCHKLNHRTKNPKRTAPNSRAATSIATFRMRFPRLLWARVMERPMPMLSDTSVTSTIRPTIHIASTRYWPDAKIICASNDRPNAKRSHAGPMACECNRGARPALAGAICWARSWVLLEAI